MLYDLSNTLRFIQAINGAYVNDKKKFTISRTGNDVPTITRFELLFLNMIQSSIKYIQWYTMYKQQTQLF